MLEVRSIIGCHSVRPKSTHLPIFHLSETVFELRVLVVGAVGPPGLILKPPTSRRWSTRCPWGGGGRDRLQGGTGSRDLERRRRKGSETKTLECSKRKKLHLKILCFFLIKGIKFWIKKKRSEVWKKGVEEKIQKYNCRSREFWDYSQNILGEERGYICMTFTFCFELLFSNSFAYKRQHFENALRPQETP